MFKEKRNLGDSSQYLKRECLFQSFYFDQGRSGKISAQGRKKNFARLTFTFGRSRSRKMKNKASNNIFYLHLSVTSH